MLELSPVHFRVRNLTWSRQKCKSRMVWKTKPGAFSVSMFSMFLEAEGEEQEVHHNIYTLQFVSEQFVCLKVQRVTISSIKC